jgi:hypothetical protein
MASKTRQSVIDIVHTRAGGKFSPAHGLKLPQSKLPHPYWVDTLPLTVRCQHCDWTWDGPTEEGRTVYRLHAASCRSARA